MFEAIHEGLDRLGFRDVIRREWQAGLVVSAIYPDDPNWDFEKIHDYCYERGFTIYPGKISTTNTFRLCALGAIDEADIRDFFRRVYRRTARDRCPHPGHVPGLIHKRRIRRAPRESPADIRKLCQKTRSIKL